MKIVYIHTSNIKIAKDVLVRTAIKAGMQYVEMENEILIEGDLFRIVEKKELCTEINLIDVLNSKLVSKENFNNFTLDTKPLYLSHQPCFSRLKKNDYKLEAKKVNDKIKIKQNYNRRRYQ